MKTLRTKVIQASAVLLGVLYISGCGGGGGGSVAQGAIDLIADYAQSNANPAPTIQDYNDAGVTGVSNDNLAAINAMVDKGVRSDYDTASEIQDLADLIGAKAVLDRKFGDGVHDFIYGVVTNPTTGKTWLNNNLGARYADTNDVNFDPQQQATSSTDFLAYGSLFQWGRKADRHELINRTGPFTSSPRHGSTTLKSNNPAHFLFIKTSGDWRVNPNNSLWAGTNAANNVCPVGYRLPKVGEMVAERSSWGAPYSMVEAFNSTLQWSYAGYRRHTTAVTYSSGIGGFYWTASISGSNAYYVWITGATSGVNNNRRAYGFAVRCIKN